MRRELEHLKDLLDFFVWNLAIAGASPMIADCRRSIADYCRTYRNIGRPLPTIAEHRRSSQTTAVHWPTIADYCRLSPTIGRPLPTIADCRRLMADHRRLPPTTI
ncbi:hypothetical protein L3Y34_014081 [Caenorhabditis briggsae]|uniref:Uncharacterized protein n=1 Tax=Caenorhabditis briggsae TaxID=6238 RepID=A0AAE9DRN5_CAEBR|nr:hypothetical protein L3Y34_014081 [Caenorhabditis briggsae]